MKKLFVLFLLSGLYLSARYDVITSQREFNKKIDNFDFSFVCIADNSNDGKKIQNSMKSLARSGDFKDVYHDRFGVLFVRADRDRNESILKAYDYKGKPLFLLFESDHKLKTTDLSGHYSVTAMKDFIYHEISDALDEIKTDIKKEKEAKVKAEQYRPKPGIHVGFGTGYYPGYGYYRGGHPYWWSRRYGYRHPYWRRHYRGYGPYRSGIYAGFSV